MKHQKLEIAHIITFIALCVSFLISSKIAIAGPYGKSVCLKYAMEEERLKGIPPNLLSAISMLKSGRWIESRGENIAWPWTIKYKNVLHFFDTQAEAIAEIEILISSSETLIEVGCMQINLHHHKQAFENIRDILDPKKNITYVANLLINLKKSSNTWLEAAVKYYSINSAKKKKFIRKLAILMRNHLNSPFAPHKNNTTNAELIKTPKKTKQTISRSSQMSILNQAFQKRRKIKATNFENKNPVIEINKTNSNQLMEWRQAAKSGSQLDVLIAMRRASQDLRRRKKLASMGKSSFPMRRRQQLESWRKTGNWQLK